jgi:hypothetical protein
MVVENFAVAQQKLKLENQLKEGGDIFFYQFGVK